MQKECFAVMNKLCKNIDIVITKPDKGSGVVILNKCDYIIKMENILANTAKIDRVGPASSCDDTSGMESRLQKGLLELFRADFLPETVYRLIRFTGSQRPRMYGLFKAHKPAVPLGPIMSMTGSAHDALSKWLASLVEPVVKRYIAHITFAD